MHSQIFIVFICINRLKDQCLIIRTIFDENLQRLKTIMGQTNSGKSMDFAFNVSSKDGKIVLESKQLIQALTNQKNPYSTGGQNVDETTSYADSSQRNQIRTNLQTEGVNQDAVVLPSFYQKCPLCSAQFSQAYKPNLLECGHFLCQQCCGNEQYCLMPDCSIQIKIKKLGYWWPKKIKDGKQEENKYYFKVKAFTQDQTLLKLKDGKQNFGDAMSKNFQIKGFIDRIKTNEAIQVIINGTTRQYSKLKGMTVNQIAAEYGLQPYTKTRKRMNQMSFTTYQQGGKLKI